MKAFVTSIGEKTTELCIWSLERNGFDVELVKGDSTLWRKLKFIYEKADDDFIRVDADVIPNRYLTPENLHPKDEWWVQYQLFDWFQQNLGFGGVQFIKKEALPALRANVDRFEREDRPETALSRIGEFYNPRRFGSRETVMGVHNYKNDLKRVAAVKANRGQSANYDFELAMRINEL